MKIEPEIKPLHTVNVCIPQIPVHKGAPYSFRMEYYHMLPSSLAWGNLNEKNMEYASRHEFVNRMLREIFIDDAIECKDKDSDYYTIDHQFYKIRNQTETVIYWLRKTADDMIALSFYMDFFVRNQADPTRIEIDCIGHLLVCDKHGKKEFQSLFQDHLPFLKRLNEVSNTYKHSFIQNNVRHLIGKDEPTVVALHLRNNNTLNQPIFDSYSLRKFVIDYTSFFLHTESLLGSYSDRWFERSSHDDKSNVNG